MSPCNFAGLTHLRNSLIGAAALTLITPVWGAPVINPLGNVTLPAGKSLIIPITATSPNSRPLTFTASSNTNGIAVVLHTNNPFWKMSVAQAAPANAPGAYLTPFRGGLVSVTNLGDLTFMLFKDLTPHSVDVNQGLTAAGFYNSNTIFHRIAPGFVIQGGDPNTNGTGGPVFRYDDEFEPTAIFSGNGQLALANSGKDTDGSQFFITLGPQRSLDFSYTLFGQLLRGFDVMTNLAAVATDTNSRPLADVIITQASWVSDTADTVLTLTATNVAGVAGTIKVIADDGLGGRTTNSFTATTIADASSNLQPFQYPNTVTNLVGPVNLPLTNTITGLEMDGYAVYWFAYFADGLASSTNVANTTGTVTPGHYKALTYNVTNDQGQLQLVVVPTNNYVGTISLRMVVSINSLWSSFPTAFPFDRQIYTLAFGDTGITAQGTNFVATALTAFTNQVIATFTNGVASSVGTNFTAVINWGDNSTNIGVVVNDLNYRKSVLGAHTYTNSGNYPVFITIQSNRGASASVNSLAMVPPHLELSLIATNAVFTWPAWAVNYQLQSNTNLAGTNWVSLPGLATLVGYNNVLTNNPANGSQYYRLVQPAP